MAVEWESSSRFLLLPFLRSRDAFTAWGDRPDESIRMAGASNSRIERLRPPAKWHRLASLGEAHVGRADGVKVVREHVQRNVSHDLGDFGVAVPRLSNLGPLFVADVS